MRERLEAISEERFRELYRSFLAEPRSEEERGAFDEGIDLDSVLPAIQIVIATVSVILLRRLRRERSADDTPAKSR